MRATADLLSEKGCRAMTMDHVASRLGISKATLYSHFRARDELITQVLDRSADEALAGIREILTQKAPGESRLRELARHLLERLLGVRPDVEPVTCCCLAEVACPYNPWGRVEAILAENGASADAPVPLGDALRALAALVEHRRREDGQVPTAEDAEAILHHLFPA